MSDTIRQTVDELPAPVPLVIGVTGHRDLRGEDVLMLRKHVRQIFLDLRNRCPHTPLVLVSALAEGADRIAARLAVAEGARLVVPLPMEQAEYERDFTSRGSLDEFRRLLARADRRVVMPPPASGRREETYALAGAWIARHAQILIALWDGNDPGKEGGTADVVRFQREGVPEPYASALAVAAGYDPPTTRAIEPEVNGPVYQIHTPRSGQPGPPVGADQEIVKLYPAHFPDNESAVRAYNRTFRRIDTFNRDAARLARRLAASADAHKAELFPLNEGEALPDGLDAIAARYAVADGLAIHFQRRAIWALRGMFLLALAAVTAFQLFSQLASFQTTSVLVFYLLALATAFGLYVPATRARYHIKYLDARALAEGLRVEFYWRLAGLGDRVEDSYLSKQRGELDWIRHALRNWDLLDEPAPVFGGQTDRILSSWIEGETGQLGFFIARARKDDRLLRRFRGVARGLVLLGIGLTIVLLFCAVRLGPTWFNRTLLAAGLAPVVAGLALGYASRRGLAEHAKQYERMALVFTVARDRLRERVAAGDRAGAVRLIRALGEEALAENGDWVLLHRDRPPEVPL